MRERSLRHIRVLPPNISKTSALDVVPMRLCGHRKQASAMLHWLAVLK